MACDLLVDDLAPIAGRVGRGGEIIAAKVDVTDEASIAEVVRTAGGADILVYVAGGVRGQRPRPLEEVSADDFDAIVDANLKGAFLFIKSVAPGMKTKGTGRIVTISSRAGLATSLTGIQSYPAAKHGQIGLVKQLAQELGPFGITVNTVAPGFMATSPDYESCGRTARNVTASATSCGAPMRRIAIVLTKLSRNAAGQLFHWRS